MGGLIEFRKTHPKTQKKENPNPPRKPGEGKDENKTQKSPKKNPNNIIKEKHKPVFQERNSASTKGVMSFHFVKKK